MSISNNEHQLKIPTIYVRIYSVCTCAVLLSGRLNGVSTGLGEMSEDHTAAAASPHIERMNHQSSQILRLVFKNTEQDGVLKTGGKTFRLDETCDRLLLYSSVFTASLSFQLLARL